MTSFIDLARVIAVVEDDVEVEKGIEGRSELREVVAGLFDTLTFFS